MPKAPATFGLHIAQARKDKGLSQKELAGLILREGGVAISPQYLNDIERDRRQPSSEHIIQEFARVLDLNADYLYFLAGTMPDDVRQKGLSESEFETAFTAFRRNLPMSQ